MTSTLAQHATLLLDDHFGTYALPLVRTAVKTANYTAVASDLVPVDTTSGAVTVTLPNAPADKSMICVKHIIQGGTNAVTIACAGSDVFNRAGGGTSATLPYANQAMLLEYTASGGIWSVLADDLPLSQLDLRFVPLHDVPTTFVTKTTTYTAASGEFVLASTTGGGWTLSLPAAPNVGEAVGIKKTSADANTLTVSPNVDGSALTLTTQNRTVLVVWDGTAWRASTGAPHHLSHEYGGVDALTSFAHTHQVDTYLIGGSYTWTKPAWAITVDVYVLGAGGGGGSGRKGAAGTVRCGGGGGAGAGFSFASLKASDLGPTVGVTVAAGGGGGAAQATNSTDGNPGTAGGGSYFGDNSTTGAHVRANGGGLGAGGTATNGTGGGGGGGTMSGGTGAAASTSGGAGNAVGNSAGSAGGGGAGGGITTGNAASAGSAGGVDNTRIATGAAAAGTSGGGTGADGETPLDPNSPVAGKGGGGGGSSTTGAAGAGGAGLYGAGGGGGGASVDSVGNSGAGGNGGDGFVIIVSRG